VHGLIEHFDYRKADGLPPEVKHSKHTAKDPVWLDRRINFNTVASLSSAKIRVFLTTKRDRE
jgi:hypothetical protein